MSSTVPELGEYLGPAAALTQCLLAQVRQQELLLKLLQQQQAAAAVPVPPAPSSPPPLWAGLAKQGLSMKTLLELQLEGERQLHKQPVPREPLRAQAPNHRTVSWLGPFPQLVVSLALRNLQAASGVIQRRGLLSPDFAWPSPHPSPCAIQMSLPT